MVLMGMHWGILEAKTRVKPGTKHLKISKITKFGLQMFKNTENIASQVCEFVYICITHGKSYHFRSNFAAKVVTFSVRNINT